MQRAIVTTGIVSTALAVFYIVNALMIRMGSLDKPGPGIYPLFVGCIFLIGSAGTLIAALLKPASGVFGWPRGRSWRRVGIVFGGAMSYLLLFPFFGYIPATTSIVLFTLYGMEMRSRPLMIGLAIVFSVGSWYAFTGLLHVPIPGLTWFD